MPGYGYSDRPASTGWDVPHIARAWVVLMKRLGYPGVFVFRPLFLSTATAAWPDVYLLNLSRFTQGRPLPWAQVVEP